MSLAGSQQTRETNVRAQPEQEGERKETNAERRRRREGEGDQVTLHLVAAVRILLYSARGRGRKRPVFLRQESASLPFTSDYRLPGMSLPTRKKKKTQMTRSPSQTKCVPFKRGNTCVCVCVCARARVRACVQLQRIHTNLVTVATSGEWIWYTEVSRSLSLKKMFAMMSVERHS